MPWPGRSACCCLWLRSPARAPRGPRRPAELAKAAAPGPAPPLLPARPPASRFSDQPGLPPSSCSLEKRARHRARSALGGSVRLRGAAGGGPLPLHGLGSRGLEVLQTHGEAHGFASSPPGSRIPAGLPAPRLRGCPALPLAAKARGASPGSRPWGASQAALRGRTWAPSPQVLEAPGAGFGAVLREPLGFHRPEMPLSLTATGWGHFSNFGDTWCGFRQGLCSTLGVTQVHFALLLSRHQSPARPAASPSIYCLISEQTSPQRGVISLIFLSFRFAKNCLSGESYFSPCVSGFVSKLVFIFSCANCYFSKPLPSRRALPPSFCSVFTSWHFLLYLLF